MVRESNIELLRLILMLFIVVHHGIVHGLGLDSFSSWGGRISSKTIRYVYRITTKCISNSCCEYICFNNGLFFY